MVSLHPLQPKISTRDLVLRQTGDGWDVEDATGRRICETLSSMAEARLVGRTFVTSRGRVWVCHSHGWSVLDDD